MKDEPSIQQLFDLTGRVALVTGGTGHLGVSISNALAEAGACVLVTSRDQSKADAVALTLPRTAGATHIGIKLDHSLADRLEEDFDIAAKAYGKIDVLVNNGHEHSIPAIDRCTAADFNQQLANATGYFLLARLLRNHAVQQQRPASIIMMASMYGLVGSYPDAYEGITEPSPASYHALKGGVIHLARHLAVYWARDAVRVNAISPGPFPSVNAPEEMVARLKTKSPMMRMGLPYELKGAVVFLASDASTYVTGHNLVVDGGWTSW